MSKISEAFPNEGRRLFEREKPIVDAFNAKYQGAKFAQSKSVKESEHPFQKMVREEIDKMIINDILEIAYRDMKPQHHPAMDSVLSQSLIDQVMSLDRQIPRPFHPHYLEAIGFKVHQHLYLEKDVKLQPMQIVQGLVFTERVRWIEIPVEHMSHQECYRELQDEIISEDECNSIDFEIKYGRMSLEEIRAELRKYR